MQCYICGEMKDEPLASLHVRNFPERLRRKCRAAAALYGETLEEFVKRVLREATNDLQEPKPKAK